MNNFLDFVTSSLQHQRIGEIVDPNGGDVFVGGFLAPDQQVLGKGFSRFDSLLRTWNDGEMHQLGFPPSHKQGHIREEEEEEEKESVKGRRMQGTE